MNTTTQRPPLSDLQGKVLAYLVKFLQMNDQLPTNAKIAEAFEWASSNSADTHLKALEKKGYLTRNELHHLMLADRPKVVAPIAWAIPSTGQFSWSPQDSRFWIPLLPSESARPKEGWTA